MSDMAERKSRSRILSMAEWAESLPVPLGRWLLVLAAIVVLRHFLEQLSGHSRTIYFLSYFIHYPMAYILPLLALSVLLAALAREKVERVTRLMLFAWLLTLLPPLVDIVAHRSAEAPQLIGYLIPRGSSLGAAFLNLLNPAYHRFQGTTTGIRVEAGLGCLLGAYYVFLKTRNIGRSVVTFVAVYVTMFFFFALPPITLAVARLMGSHAENVYLLFFSKADVHRAFTNATPFALSDLSNALIDLFVVVPVLGLWYRLYDRDAMASIARDIDWVRVGLHVAATLGGAALGARLLLGSEGLFSVSTAFDAVSLAGLAAASFFTALTAGAICSLHGESPGNAPGADRDRTLKHAAFFFSFACLFALTVSYVALTYVLAALSAWYLYYAAPFRLGRFPLLGGFVAGAALLFSLSLGYAAYAGGSASLWLPGSVTALALFIPTLSLLARDVWAPSSERPALSAFLSEGRARDVAGACVFVSCLMPGAFLAMPVLLIPGAVAGAAAFTIVARGRRSVIPAGLSAVAAVLLLVSCLLGACRAPVLESQLQATSFSEMSRRAGSFSLSGESREAAQGMEEGYQLFRQGDYEAAAGAFRRVLEQDPENADAYVSIGSAYLRLERMSEAARAFRKAIDIVPSNARAHVGLGQTYQLYGDLDSAFAELTKALELEPDDPDVVYALSAFFKTAGDPEQEAEALERTLELDPGRSDAYERLAEIHEMAGDYADAINVMNRAIGAGAEFEHLYTQLSQAYYRNGDVDAALGAIRTEVERNPKLASPHAVLAGLLAQRGENDEARAEFEKAISLTKDARLRSRLEAELKALGE